MVYSSHNAAAENRCLFSEVSMQDIDFIYNFDQLKLNMGICMCGNSMCGIWQETYSLLKVVNSEESLLISS